VLVAVPAIAIAAVITTLEVIACSEDAGAFLAVLAAVACTVCDTGQTGLLVLGLTETVSAASATVYRTIPTGLDAVTLAITAPRVVDAGTYIAEKMLIAATAEPSAAVATALDSVTRCENTGAFLAVLAAVADAVSGTGSAIFAMFSLTCAVAAAQSTIGGTGLAGLRLVALAVAAP